jgi:glucose dehydrogenase
MYEEGFRWWSLGYAAALAFVLFGIILAVTALTRIRALVPAARAQATAAAPAVAPGGRG